MHSFATQKSFVKFLIMNVESYVSWSASARIRTAHHPSQTTK